MLKCLPYHSAFLLNKHTPTLDNWAPLDYFFCKAQTTSSLLTVYFILNWWAKSGGYDAWEHCSLVLCLDGADMLSWNLTVNDRQSSLSPSGLCCSPAPFTRVWYCIGNSNNTQSLWLPYCKQTFSLAALAKASCMLSPNPPSISPKSTHISTHRPPTTQSLTHSKQTCWLHPTPHPL